MRFSAAASLLALTVFSTAESFSGSKNESPNKIFGALLPSAVPFARGGALRASVVEGTISASNLELISERGRVALKKMIERDDGSQRHIYSNWPEPGIDDEGKRKLADQIADLDASYPGGITAYIEKAKVLLKESAEGVNSFSDFVATVPEGESLSYDGDGTMSFQEAEKLGKTVLGDIVFILVAGGLGERLGYSGIKLSLETNLCSNESFLQVYVRYIQAIQEMVKKEMGKHVKIPLVIMTSGDTDPLTRQMLKDNNNFGMENDQIQIVMQDKVAALMNGNAGLALSEKNRWEIQTKPHGHGDVHHLLLREGLIDKWEKDGKKYAIFLQDTNALVINSVIPTLGVSVKKGFQMNSICIPRLAGEAAGAITRLEHKFDQSKSLTINVEYNQLDPLLRTQGDCKGDVADETGYSPFPGNANNIVIEMETYAKTLRGEDKGVVVEFVNPKYKDETRKVFKKPTRLECMMQDIPKLFQKEMGNQANIGFTMFDRWFTFSPAKNALEAGVEAVSKGSTAPGTMSSAESDKYIQNQRKLKYAGMTVPVTTEKNLVTVCGIPVTPGPRIYLSSSFAITQEELQAKIVKGEITTRSSLILNGNGINIKNLYLDGALVINACNGAEVTVDSLEVKNEGWQLTETPDGVDVPETVSIRGYTMKKLKTAEFNIKEPGKYIIGKDGICKKL
mmetsp:Transcript_38416/g.43856  ORF Transcript_38416/g.43856 Transcript_38416/m.43856 type:complete len:680 (-) Transcript_38416:69-2108(-)|eukprot:CAMPEP_0194146058 /NCGR_PEP_ID=MMETSP0152-20130528/19452_1 /TAXON_ID=1049557 /ORGANISM="Thalassiothrix antarctica, Strain L6-D1" /LENGTH=679 /DNA_ID=CAMNT_0038846473 /DNA_START=15 /DNA_END=2054 /DNA_ORIENTATION=+